MAPLLPSPPQKTTRQANAWIAVFSFIGNYFWTHYFYSLLGAAYTFPAHQLNQARRAGGRGLAGGWLVVVDSWQAAVEGA